MQKLQHQIHFNNDKEELIWSPTVYLTLVTGYFSWLNLLSARRKKQYNMQDGV